MAYRGEKNYYQHSVRESGFSDRLAKFELRNSIRQLSRVDKSRKFLDNGDCEMTVKENQSRASGMRYNPMAARRSLPTDLSHKLSKRAGAVWPENSPCWYLVSLSHGKKYSRENMLNTIRQYIQPIPFVPFNIKTEGDDMTFFVDNEDLAKAIYAADFKIQMPDGWKVQVKVRPCMPFVEMDESLKQEIRVVMSSLFDMTKQHLNLTKFHANDEFIKKDLFVPLNRQNILLTVLEIIAECVPNIQSLDLSDNKIFATGHFVMLKRNTPNLKSLNLSKNKIRNLSALSCLQGMKLETLMLDNNPVCYNFCEETAYFREVRKNFKSLRHLDGIDLPPPVDFGIEEETQRSIPRSHNTFLCTPDGEAFTKQFLEQFFTMYDGQTGRDSLIEAYTENAQFSMTAYTTASYGFNLNRYIPESRNWKRVRFDRIRSRLLHHGKVEIVRFLNTLPKTEHDLSTFTVDLLVYRPELISLCICGVFRETDNTENITQSNIKAFSRTFILVPTGTGFNIVNDMLSITNATPNQLSKAFQSTQAAAVPSVSSAPTSPQAELRVTPNGGDMVPDELSRKRELVTMLAMQSGMNLFWTEKCLAETNWDLNSAMYAFTELNKIGKIPKEAFEK